MWLFLGLISAILAGSVAESLMPGRDGPGADDSADDDSGAEGQDGQAQSAGGLPELVDIGDTDDGGMETGTGSGAPALPWDHDPDNDLPLAGGYRDTGSSDDSSWRDDDDAPDSSDLFPDPPPPAGLELRGGHTGSLLQGGAGNDTLHGGGGNDTLTGGPGNDILIAGGGANHLTGGPGSDTLIGGAGDDTLDGGWGDDLLVAGQGNTLLMGGDGNDTLVGALPDDDGNDRGGANFLNGGAGDDLLIIGAGDIAHGGDGADTFMIGSWIADGQTATIQDYTPGEDMIVLSYDPAQHDPGGLAVVTAPDAPENALIVLDGVVLAEVIGGAGLTVPEIALRATGVPATDLPGPVPPDPST